MFSIDINFSEDLVNLDDMELQLSPESTVPVDEHIASSLSGKMNFFVKFEAYETNTSSEQTLFYFNITVQLSYGSHN